MQLQVYTFLFYLKIAFVVIGLSMVCNTPTYAQKEFPEWSEGLYAEVKRRIDERQGGNRGAEASARLRSIWQFINVHLNDPINEKLEAVNDEMNGLTWIADSELWKSPDYWATPFETITTFGGDCEDIAIAKYALLVFMGVPAEHMGFAHVITAQREHHMVLMYRAPGDDDALILDNLDPNVKPTKDRPDLIAVYAFQERNDGSENVRVITIKDKGDAQRSIKNTLESRRLKKWASVKKRSKENFESLIPFNEGNPLFPEWVPRG